MSSLPTRLENTPAETLRGIGLVIAASALVPGLDAIGKLLVTEHGLSVGEASLYRFCLQVALILPVGLALEGAMVLRSPQIRLNLGRGACLAIGGLCLLGGLRFMPLGDTIAIFMIGPLIVTLLSALLLKEHVGWRRTAAVFTGFAGALIIVRPSYAVFGPASLLPVAAAAAIALYLILSRRASRGTTPLAMQFFAGLGGIVVLGAAMLFGHPFGIAELSFSVPRGAWVWTLIVASGALSTLAHLLFVEAYKLAPASVLAPFSYVEIVSAVLLGLLIFGEFPDAPKWLGIAIVVGSGLFIYWREQRSARVPEKPPRLR
ncbi:DMT family transporter [Afifella pfennigii]|uniref:DMT family transporter n=1 Tax=Afifella pfennigii TaxID=209897 RepID=UPI00068C677C|nr:DMT family transporter [Afifella pfennigii]